MGPFTENPFAALTIVVAPAILTNASSVLCLGTGNRLARVMDRARIVSDQLARLTPNEPYRAMYHHQLEGLEMRWKLVLRALRFFYMSLGSFAAAVLISLLGSALRVFTLHVGSAVFVLLGLLSGTVGVVGLVVGCTMLIQETRIAVQSLTEEAQLAALPSDTSQ